MKQLGTITLETDNLILRKFKIEDAEDMFNNWASDPECNKYVSYPLHQSIEETKEIVQMMIDEADDGYNWAIELKSTDEVIGNISVVSIRKKHCYCEVGYSLGSTFWGKGYATEALKKVVQFLLIDCGFNLVEAYHDVTNPASGKVMKKVGMKKEAVLRARNMNKITNKLEDLACYSIIKEDLI